VNKINNQFKKSNMSYATELEKLAQTFEGKANENTEQPAEQPVEQPTEQPAEQTVVQPVEQPTEQPTVQPTEQPTAEGRTISVAGMDIKIKQEVEKEETPVDINDTKSFFEAVEKEYNISLSSLKDAMPLFAKTKEVDKLKEQLTEQQLESGEVQKLFSSLPVEIKASIQAFSEGKDYKSVLKKVVGGSLDYSKPANYYGKEEMIKAYHPELTQDDFEDMSERESKALYDSAVMRYNNEHKEYTEGMDKTISETQKRASVFLDSVKKSTENLTSTYANLSKSEVSKIEGKMKTNIADLFYNEDGMYKSDAAERLYYAMNGKEIINALILEIEKSTKRKIKEAESKTAETIVSQYTNDKIKPAGGGGEALSIEDAVKQNLPKALGGTA
jgi:hypothetical protein